MRKFVILGICLFVLLAAGVVGYYVRNNGFTPWMTLQEMDVFWKSLEEKDDVGQNFFDRGNWLTGVEGRWHDGRPQFRLRLDGVPSDRPSGWWWWFNQDEQSMGRHIQNYADKNCVMIYHNVFEWPDGTKRYSAVWHKRKPAPADISVR